MRRFAEVAVDVPAGSDRTFSYSFPDSLSVQPGDLVRVPFGARTLQGIVFSVGEEPQITETRDIVDVRGPAPHLDATRLSLARWISRYYRCSLFEAAAQMLPPGGRSRSLGPSCRSQAGMPSDDERRSCLRFSAASSSTSGRGGAVDQQRLIALFGERAGSSVASLVRRGIVSQTVAHRRPSAGPKRVQTAALTDAGRLEGAAWLTGGGRRAPRQACPPSGAARRRRRASPLRAQKEARVKRGQGAARPGLRRETVRDGTARPARRARLRTGATRPPHVGTEGNRGRLSVPRWTTLRRRRAPSSSRA